MSMMSLVGWGIVLCQFNIQEWGLGLAGDGCKDTREKRGMRIGAGIDKSTNWYSVKLSEFGDRPGQR
jgi:hypothetical protein